MCATNDHRYVCRYHNSVLSSFMTYHRVCNKSSTTCLISGAGFPYYYGTPQFTSRFQWGSCCSAFRLPLSVLYINVCSISLGHCIFCLSYFCFGNMITATNKTDHHDIIWYFMHYLTIFIIWRNLKKLNLILHQRKTNCRNLSVIPFFTRGQNEIKISLFRATYIWQFENKI